MPHQRQPTKYHEDGENPIEHEKEKIESEEESPTPSRTLKPPVRPPLTKNPSAMERAYHFLNMTWRQRLRHFTWAWFTVTMSTGGLSVVIRTIPFAFHGQYTVGVILYIFNLVLYFLFNLLIIARFIAYPKALKASFLHPTEALFIPCWLVTMGIILIGGGQYATEKAGHWWIVASRVIFWVYCALAIAMSSFSYLVMWATQTHTIKSMTPAWIFPIYPCLLMGPIAATLVPHQTFPHSLNMLVAGTTVQGIGFLISLMVYAAYISRLMTDKLPDPPLRPGMFISVGPSAFTVIGLIGMGKAAVSEDSFGTMIVGVKGDVAQDVIRIVTVWCGVWLWGLAMWFCLITIAAHILCVWEGTLYFRLNWWSFLFPNTALVIATFRIAESFDCDPIRVIGTVMACILVLFWFFIFFKMLLAVRRREILWHNKDEDREEGGFKQPEHEFDGTPIRR